MHAALTIIEPNERSGNLEIMHRMFAHDLELVLADLTDTVDPFGQEDVSQVIGAYVGTRFVLYDTEGQPLDLTYIGSEPKGEAIWGYFETAQPEDMATFYMRNNLLFKAFPEQINQANFTVGEATQTLIFRHPDDVQGLKF